MSMRLKQSETPRYWNKDVVDAKRSSRLMHFHNAAHERAAGIAIATSVVRNCTKLPENRAGHTERNDSAHMVMRFVLKLELVTIAIGSRSLEGAAKNALSRVVNLTQNNESGTKMIQRSARVVGLILLAVEH